MTQQMTEIPVETTTCNYPHFAGKRPWRCDAPADHEEGAHYFVAA